MAKKKTEKGIGLFTKGASDYLLVDTLKTY